MDEKRKVNVEQAIKAVKDIFKRLIDEGQNEVDAVDVCAEVIRALAALREETEN